MIIRIILVLLMMYLLYKLYIDSDVANLTCIKSTVDGNEYCVRERKNMKNAVNLLAETAVNCKRLVRYLNNNYGHQENVKLLVNNFSDTKIKEILPTSKYTAYSENKGEKIALCLSKKDNPNNLVDKNTLMFVAIHEMAHCMTKSVGHTKEFWDNFKFLLSKSSEINIYEPEDYNKTPKMYCSKPIKSNPLF